MPSRKKTKTTRSSSTRSSKVQSGSSSPKKSTAQQRHPAFYPLLALTLVVWILYRQMFSFPVWFDETVGKLIFFGLPVWLYILFAKASDISDTFAPAKLRSGMLLGLAIGGMYGFVAAFISVFQSSAPLQTAALFDSAPFWWEFFLSLMTGVWESLFFFSWVMTVIRAKHHSWSLPTQVVVTALIFLLFHVSNTLLRFEGMTVLIQLVLLFWFAVGQALVFYRWKNMYALAISHALWGMVLLFYS